MNIHTCKKCLMANELERLVLENEFEYRTQFIDHINRCNRCRRLFFEARMFHQILSTELNKPISSRIINLVRGLETKKVFD